MIKSKPPTSGTSTGSSTPHSQLLCQRCRLPLGIHDKLNELDATALDRMLSASAPASPDERRSDTGNLYPRFTLAHYKQEATGSDVTTRAPLSTLPTSDKRHDGNPTTDSFVVLDKASLSGPPTANGTSATAHAPPIGGYEAMIRAAELQEGAENGSKDPFDPEGGKYSLSARFQTSDRLYDIISSRTELDKPICSECMESLVEALRQQYSEVARHRDIYAAFLEQVQQCKPTPEQQLAAEKELAEITKEQDRVMAELRSVEQERLKVESEIEELERQAAKLDEDEQKFWVTRNKYAQELEDFTNERDAFRSQLARDTALVERLKKTNVYSDVFRIEGGSAAVDRMAGIAR
ncbi:autophagy protein Apg6-domain-containing protein [Limtongia smithiae]|uniref:autophagy protein Apg6-domain-containing protein n=1 Tax=Limtongia smithiae TaxID=1125753 RepID=UPI0034CD3E31